MSTSDPSITRWAGTRLRASLMGHATATLGSLRERTDADTVAALDAWDLLVLCAGKLKASEGRLLEVFHEDEAERSAMRMRVTTGETTPLTRPLRRLMEGVDADWTPLFEAAFTAGATVDEDHADAAPGALVGWGAALGSFEALVAAFEAICKSAGRRRYLELAMVADRFFDEPKAAPFLLREMNDFLGEIGDWERSKTSFAFFALLARQHPDAVEAASAVLSQGPMNGASWQTLLALVRRVEALELRQLVPGLQALVQRGFGRHDDGTRGEVVCTWARMGGADAVPVLEGMLEDITDVRTTCEEAALLAGLLTAQPEHAAARERSAAVSASCSGPPAPWSVARRGCCSRPWCRRRSTAPRR